MEASEKKPWIATVATVLRNFSLGTFSIKPAGGAWWNVNVGGKYPHVLVAGTLEIRTVTTVITSWATVARVKHFPSTVLVNCSSSCLVRNSWLKIEFQSLELPSAVKKGPYGNLPLVGHPEIVELVTPCTQIHYVTDLIVIERWVWSFGSAL